MSACKFCNLINSIDMINPHRMGDRIEWIDSARGIGIILVVAGHVFTQPESIHRIIFTFHMPLFFMISGMVFKAQDWRKFWKSRFFSLALPYFSFLLLVTVVDIAVAPVFGREPSLPWFDNPQRAIVQAAFGGEALKGVYGIFWFVTCLFAAQCMANAFLLRQDRGVITMVLAILGALIFSYSAPHILSPGNVLAAPMAFVFLMAGWLYRRFGIIDRTRDAAAAILLVGIGGIFLVAPMDMKYLDYGTPALTALAALLASHGIFLIAKFLSLPIMGVLGRASLVVMFLHLTIYHNLSGYLPEWVIFPVALLVPFLMYCVADRIACLRWLLLGGRGKTSMESLRAQPA